jgi:hypothetical protein
MKNHGSFPGSTGPRDGFFSGLYFIAMDRPTRFEHSQFLGDKRTQAVYDLDDVEDTAVIDELAAGSHTQTFGPDTLAEARNRGYRLRKI